MPFLNQITVVQEKHGFWEHFLPYAPLVTAVLSAGISTVGILVTCGVARKAREITSQQKAIAAQVKQIAQDKLDTDIFDKRYKVYSAYLDFFGKVTDPLVKREDLIIHSQEFISNIFMQKFLFHEKDVETLNFIKKNILNLLVCKENTFSSISNVIPKMQVDAEKNIKLHVMYAYKILKF